MQSKQLQAWQTQFLILIIFSVTCLSEQQVDAQTGASPLSVALIVGGYQRKVEIYSPDGSCQHKLSSVPINGDYFTSPVVALINETIIACGGEHDNKMCWTYQPETDQWRYKTNSSYSHSGMPGSPYKSKLFILDDFNPEVLDLKRNLWSSWPPPPARTRWGSCMVQWRDSFYVFGGRDHPKLVQKFDHNSQRWSLINNSFSPIMMLYSSCIVLPSDEILIVGSSFLNYTRFSAIYNPISNNWKSVGDGKFDRQGASVVRLGYRIYVLGGGDNPPTEDVEELQACFNFWSPVKHRMFNHRRNFGTITVPAKMFQHLGCEGIRGGRPRWFKLMQNFFGDENMKKFPDSRLKSLFKAISGN